MTQNDLQVPAQDTGRSPADLVEAYAAAWNAHDGAAVAALVTGTYVDPTLPGPVSGAAIAEMVDGLCAAFPDLRFEHTSTLVDGDRCVFQWVLHGTNDGVALPGAPAPTGSTVALPGVDVVTTSAGRIVDVVGYFDQVGFLAQLGLQVFPMPQDTWPVSCGTAIRVDLGHTALPGALTMTWIEVPPEQQGEVIARSTDIVTALASEPAFLGFQSTAVGRRSTTLTAWTSPEAAEAALARNAPHSAAMARMQSGFGERGFTSFWQPYRVNSQFADCTCGAAVALEGTAVTCACGLEVQTSPYL